MNDTLAEVVPVDGNERRSRIAAERRARTVALFNSGLTYKQIMAETGLTHRQVQADIHWARVKSRSA